MGLSVQPYRGTRDLFPKEKRTLNFLTQNLFTTAERFGFSPYDGPLLEEVELYKAKSGEELINEQIYAFYDRGERHVAIRPEMTPTLARMVAQIYKEVPLPIRLYSMPNLMRYERPQKGRLREHWQFNADIFGAPEGFAELEIIQLVISLFENFGANSTHFSINLNDRRLVDAIMEKTLSVDKETAYKLYKIIDRSKKITEEQLKQSISEILTLETSQKKFFNYLKIDSIHALKNFCATNDLTEETKELFNFLDLSDQTNISSYIKFDPAIVRGLDYYTGIVFEVFDLHPDNKRALCGGGSYKNLLSLFNGPELLGVGVGIGDVTFLDFLSSHNLLPTISAYNIQLTLSYAHESQLALALDWAKTIRSAGINVAISPSAVKIKKAFQYNERMEASALLLVGFDESDSSKVELKLKNEKQSFFAHDQNRQELINHLVKTLG